jgi:uncharacterized protein YjbJ (UPF0337 family)
LLHRRLNAGELDAWRDVYVVIRLSPTALKARPQPTGVRVMNWDRIEGNWKQFTGKVKQQWGKLTDDDLQQVEGRRVQLVGKIQERYGIAKDEAEKQVDTWLNNI